MSASAEEEISEQTVCSTKSAKALSVDLDVRDLPRATPWQPGDPIKDMPRRRLDPAFIPPGLPKNPVASRIDPLLSTQAEIMQFPELMIPAKNVRSIVQQIEGAGYTGVNSPDRTGDVGKNYYIQMINSYEGAIFLISGSSASIFPIQASRPSARLKIFPLPNSARTCVGLHPFFAFPNPAPPSRWTRCANRL